MKKLAIVIIGLQNSGKTSTIKHFLSKYSGKRINRLGNGWSELYINSMFKNLKIIIYRVPSSPTEKQKKLFNTISFLPNIVILAEQKNGKEYNNSILFLKQNNYEIIEFIIEDTSTDYIWDRFTVSNRNSKLDNRSLEIMNTIKNFLKNNFVI